MKYLKHLSQLALCVTCFILPSMLLSTERDEVVKSESIISQEGPEFDCYTPSLIEVSHGTLCAVWKGPGAMWQGEWHDESEKNTIELKPDRGIWISFFSDNEWSEPEQIVLAHNIVWNPVLAKQPNGDITLFYRVGVDPRQSVSLFRTSSDGGHTWSAEEMLPAGIIGPTKAKPLFDSEGNMICGSSVGVGSPEDQWKAYACWVEIYSNERWSKYGPIEIPNRKFGCTKPVLFWSGEEQLKWCAAIALLK